MKKYERLANEVLKLCEESAIEHLEEGNFTDLAQFRRAVIRLLNQAMLDYAKDGNQPEAVADEPGDGEWSQERATAASNAILIDAIQKRQDELERAWGRFDYAWIVSEMESLRKDMPYGLERQRASSEWLSDVARQFAGIETRLEQVEKDMRSSILKAYEEHYGQTGTPEPIRS